MLNTQIISLKRQGKENVKHKPAIENEDLAKLKRLKPLQSLTLFPCFEMCGFMLSCFFVGEEEKGKGSSKDRVSHLKQMPLEEGLSQWRMMR